MDAFRQTGAEMFATGRLLLKDHQTELFKKKKLNPERHEVKKIGNGLPWWRSG